MGRTHPRQCILTLVCFFALVVGLVWSVTVSYDHENSTLVTKSLLERVNPEDAAVIDISAKVDWGWFFVRTMFANADEAATIINEKYKSTDSQNRDWQRDGTAFTTVFGHGARTWVVTDNIPCNLQPVSRALQSLHTHGGLPENKCQRWSQAQAFTPRYWYDGPQINAYTGLGASTKVGASGAEYGFSIDPSLESITILQAQSVLDIMQERRSNGQLPAQFNKMPGKLGPTLRRFSDVLAYALRRLVTPSKGDRKLTAIEAKLHKLRYVAFQSIRGQSDCLSVISTVIRSFT